jgi:serine/threonine protein kinase
MSPVERSSFEPKTTLPALPPAPRSESSRGLLVGYQVGRYQLVEKLGGGVMATVYRAEANASGEPVAIKVLLPDADATLSARFQQEAHTHGQLRHPNIVPILDEGYDAASALTYLVMPLIAGAGLNGLIEAQERLSVHEAAGILARVARALDYAHRQGIIHRDVKPSNVLLQRAVTGAPGAVFVKVIGGAVIPLLSDFGIARALDAPELTGIGRTIGTPTYMSPEQCADSHELDQRSDLYSLGAVFYRCLVGRPPFSGSTTQILHAHVYEPLMIPEAVLAMLPAAAVEILQRSLAKEPAARYASGEEMATALEQLVTSLPTSEAAAESTTTMPALPAVRPAMAMQVLVPAPSPRTPEMLPVVPPEVAVHTPSVTAPPPPVAPGAPAASAPEQRRWIGATLGVLLSTLLLVGAVWAVLNLLPDDLFARRASLTDAPTAVATPAASVLTPSPEQSASAEVASTATPDATPATDAIATATPPPPPTPAGAIEGYWREAEDAFADQDWQVALDFYTLVQRIDASYQREMIADRLFDVQIVLAAEALIDNAPERAVKAFDAALALRPDAEPVQRIRTAANALTTAEGDAAVSIRRVLWGALVNYAGQLGQVEAYCSAAAQLTAALAIWPDGVLDTQLTKFRAGCEQARALAIVGALLIENGGRILYSTQEGDRYNIYSAAAQVNSDSTLLIADGAQVGAQRAGPLIAFRSTRASAPGIALFDLSAARDPGEWEQQLTSAPEDAQDAPPGWASDGSAFVYSTARADDRQPRIFVHALEGGAEVELGLGKDPAWEPAAARIVYNGVDGRGAQPGLYIMSTSGENRLRLTDNGNDLRPVWSPNGNDVVFMSTRNGNWDVYRLSLRDGTLLQLTDDPAQDGLPAISPDGKLVIFASDRGGVWRIYAVPIDGGVAVPLFAVEGVLTNWLEHSIQWTR